MPGLCRRASCSFHALRDSSDLAEHTPSCLWGLKEDGPTAPKRALLYARGPAARHTWPSYFGAFMVWLYTSGAMHNIDPTCAGRCVHTCRIQVWQATPRGASIRACVCAKLRRVLQRLAGAGNKDTRVSQHGARAQHGLPWLCTLTSRLPNAESVRAHWTPGMGSRQTPACAMHCR
jgi:hypothetical protein